jgi:hypothetical protein
MHYRRHLYHGDVHKTLQTTDGVPMAFYLEKVLTHLEDSCFLWPFSKDTCGYGHLLFDGKVRSVHRLVCEATNGPPPTAEHHAAHNCTSASLGCCAPKHMRWATRTENMADKIKDGTHPRGEKVKNSKLKATDVFKIRSLKGKKSSAEIARSFGVAASTISSIQNLKKWAWLSSQPTGEKP